MFNCRPLESNVIESRIEDLRNKLNCLICNNKLTDDVVIRYSEELDKLILKYIYINKQFTN